MHRGVRFSIFSIIPSLPNGLILSLLSVLRRFHRKRLYIKRPETRIFSADHKESIRRNNGYIEDQNSYTDLSYGKRTVKYSGCEVIAVYNALSHMNDRRYDLISLLGKFEVDGCILSGEWGTAPSAIKDFFIAEGYIVKQYRLKDKIDLPFDTFILVIYNDKYDIRQQIHTVCVTLDKNMYTVHNMYGNGRAFGGFNSIEDLLQNHSSGNAKMIYLLGIKRKVDDR